MASTHAVPFAKFLSLAAAALSDGKNEKSNFWTQRADPKSGPSGGPKNGSGLVFLNSSSAQFADPKPGPLGRAEKSLAAPLLLVF
jgi:hypothetical protein